MITARFNLFKLQGRTKMSDPVFHIAHITMDATVENFKNTCNVLDQLTGVELLQFSLSSNPVAGESWKNGEGIIHELTDNSDTRAFALQSQHGSTFGTDGVWLTSETSLRNLVERVGIRPQINDGEYWMDRSGTVHHIMVENPQSQVVSSSTGIRKWTSFGRFNLNIAEASPYDLVKKMVSVDDCHTITLQCLHPPMVTRTLRIKMEATFANFFLFRELVTDKLINVNIVDFVLSELPQPGDIWKDGFGVTYVLKATRGNVKYSLTCEGGGTWTRSGIFSTNPLSQYNLIQRISKSCDNITIADGEYWMDRTGNVHQVRVIDPSMVHAYTYPYTKVSPDNNPVSDDGMRMTWTSSGEFQITQPNHPLDLVRKMVFVDECGK
jgi:hypothetical protein